MNKSRFTKDYILIIDDDEDFAESLADVLEISGYKVAITHNAEEAKAKAIEIKPMIGLVDIRLGLNNGITLINDLKKICPNIQCLIMTAYARIDTAIQAIQKGAYDYLKKPFENPDLLATIERCYEKICLEQEKRVAEEALRKSEELYRRFFEEDLTGDFIINKEGKILLGNPPLAHIFNIKSIKELQSYNFSRFFPDKNSWNDFLEKVRQEKKLKMYEIELRKIDGGTVNIIANVIGRFNDNNILTEISGYFMDITKNKELESMYLQSQKMEAIGRLAGGIAHDFNNLLTAILVHSSFIKQRAKKDSQTYFDVEEIRKTALRASSLIQQLLTFSRRQSIQPGILNINEIISDMQKMLKTIIKKDIELIIELEPNIALIKADQGQITQVIMNLAINSSDAMPDGGKLTIKTSIITIKDSNQIKYHNIKPGEYVKLTVTDTGFGMDEETQFHIFEPFFTTKESPKGTGLGLATVFGIVQQSKGHIIVESKLNSGTKFEILLPRVDEKQISTDFPNTDHMDLSVQGS